MKRCSRVPVYRISVTSWNSRNIQARRMLRGSMQNVQQVFPRISDSFQRLCERTAFTSQKSSNAHWVC